MFEIPLSEDDRGAVSRLLEQLRDLRARHPVKVGLGEMAIGAALLAYGTVTGEIELGRHVVASAAGLGGRGAAIGGATGAAAGLLASQVIGGIGIAAMGGAVSVPAMVLIGGGSLIFSLAGYAAGDITAHPAFSDPAQMLMAGAALPVGLWFLIRGCRRLMGGKSVADALAKAGDGFVSLRVFAGEIVAKSLEELNAFARRNSDIGLGATATVAGGAAATVVGANAAAGSVTLLGSKALGGAALAAGLISAPIWPAVAAGTAAAGLTGFVAWTIIKRRRGDRARK